MSTFANEFTICGDLRFDAQSYRPALRDHRGAQILCFADVEYDGCRYRNILLLRLDIQGHPDECWVVLDEFSSLLPYMKPVRAFREYLEAQLRAFCESLSEIDRYSPGDIYGTGIQQYIEELNQFHEVCSLPAIGEVPCAERSFFVRELVN